MTQSKVEAILAEAIRKIHSSGWWVSGQINLTPPSPQHKVIEGENGTFCIVKSTHVNNANTPLPNISDGPPCPKCGMMTRRTGACHTCQSCGETTSCG